VAEESKRRLEDQLAGRIPTTPAQDGGQPFATAIQAFITNKEVEDVGKERRDKYQTELDRFASFCESRGVFVLQGVTEDIMSAYKAAWPALYPSTFTRHSVQARLKCFLGFCTYRKWLDRVPKFAPVKITEPPTEPLTDEEYADVLAAVPEVFPNAYGAQVAAVIQTMRWSGMAVGDTSRLRRGELSKRDGYYAIQRVRQKILATKGSNRAEAVYVPIPTEIGILLDSVVNGNPEYVFWDKAAGKGATLYHFAHNMSLAISKVFTKAGVQSDGNLVSHRLRDTFACDLLSKGVPIYDVAKLLGHSSVKTTERHYAKWVKGRQDRLDALVVASWGTGKKIKKG
jgi:integrase